MSSVKIKMSNQVQNPNVKPSARISVLAHGFRTAGLASGFWNLTFISATCRSPENERMPLRNVLQVAHLSFGICHYENDILI